MPKDLSQMQITVLVPTNKVFEVTTWLEDNGASSMMVRAYRNGATPPPTLKEEMNRAYLKGRKMPIASTVGKSAIQQEWVARHAKGDFTSSAQFRRRPPVPPRKWPRRATPGRRRPWGRAMPPCASTAAR